MSELDLASMESMMLAMWNTQAVTPTHLFVSDAGLKIMRKLLRFKPLPRMRGARGRKRALYWTRRIKP